MPHDIFRSAATNAGANARINSVENSYVDKMRRNIEKTATPLIEALEASTQHGITLRIGEPQDAVWDTFDHEAYGGGWDPVPEGHFHMQRIYPVQATGGKIVFETSGGRPEVSISYKNKDDRGPKGSHEEIIRALLEDYRAAAQPGIKAPEPALAG